MKRSLSLALAAALIGAPSASYAQGALVEIVSPIDGESYPRTGTTNAGAAFVPFSIATRCPSSDYTFKWGVDGDTLGSAAFYDQGTIQFSMKVPVGSHEVWGSTNCADGQAAFEVQ